MKIALALVSLLGLAAQSSAYWHMIFNDEFNGNSLDRSKWDVEVNCLGGGNHEKQCYTDRTNNIFVTGGKLHLRAIREWYQGSRHGCTLNEDSCTWTQPSTSGRIRTLKAWNGSFLYGRIEGRMKMPKGNFLWPAFWMMPTDSVYGHWARSGEIDIMEWRGQEPNRMSASLHFGGQWPHNQHITSGDRDFHFDFSNDFHTFAIEWNHLDIKFFVDHNQFWTPSVARSFGDYGRNVAPFDQKFHIILNLAVGGAFFDPNRFGHFDIQSAASTWRQDFEVDYIRVFQWR